jgi:hypothetical protein
LSISGGHSLTDPPQDVIDNVVTSLRDILVKSIRSFAETPTEKWVKKEPNQIILTTSLVYFTRKMEQARNLYCRCSKSARKKRGGNGSLDVLQHVFTMDKQFLLESVRQLY